MINILFTSAGRRVELIQEFIKAKEYRNIEGRIICADMSDTAPALFFADKAYTVPPIRDPNYIESLLNICRVESINLVIPTIDTELEILSRNAEAFLTFGTDVLVSSSEVISIARNKLETYHFFKRIGLKTPESYGVGMDYSGSFPCFIKPLSGSSSINAFKVKNQRELEFFKYYIGDYIIQELIVGEEYTIDITCDFDGNPIYITPRVRLATRSGEVLKACIADDERLVEQSLRIVEALKPKGPLTVQAIRSRKDNEYYFIEINARFGGGSPVSMMSGADSAGAIYDMLTGRKLDSQLYAAQTGLVFLRFDQSIVLRQKADGSYEKI